MVPLKKYKLKLNSSEKLEVLLQELYDEACKNIEQIQTEMNKLSNSIQLNDEAVDAKAKYAKAMNDYITNKDKAIGRKLDVAKLMAEIIKYNGNTKKAFEESNAVGDWGELIDKARLMEEKGKETESNKREEYRIK